MPALSLDAYATAEILERTLGDPLDAQNLFSFQHQMELDEQEAFPEEVCDFLYQWGLFDYFIPAAYGGKLHSFEEALSILRVLSRRDLTVAIALGQTYLGAVHIWLAGSDEQRHHVAELIKQNQLMAFALTERLHGSDVLASDVQVTQKNVGDKSVYHLTGEKWLINNCTRARALTVFARTEPAGGARGFSLFLVDKIHLDPASYTYCAKVKTYGIRGADISGIRFQDSQLPSEARIGQVGAGLEIALLGLMITRTMCVGFALGTADSALRTVLTFARERRIYGDAVIAIPQAQKTLVDAFTDLLIADCASLAAARGLHIVPEQFSVWSAIAKYFVPTTIENLIRDLAIVLGARYYLREAHNSGIFQKLLRDCGVISLFDGSTVVNLSVICAQIPSLFAYRRKINEGQTEKLRLRLDALFSLHRPLPEFEAHRLTLSNRGQDDVVQGMALAIAQLSHRPEIATDDANVVEWIVTLAQEVFEQINEVDQHVQELINSGGRTIYKSPAMFELAKQYCTLHTAATCLQMWLYNRTMLDEFFAKGEWLVLCLDRLLATFQPRRAPVPATFGDAAMQEALRLHEQNQAFSIVPFQLATQTQKA
ncbi:acyl-CoA dehydrogenase [soil metagenome]